MDISDISVYFEAFSGQSVADNLVYLQTAIIRTKSLLKEDSYEEKEEIHALCGAVANLLYVTAKNTKDSLYLTKAGNTASDSEEDKKISVAAELCNHFKKICSEYIKDDDFFFKGA